MVESPVADRNYTYCRGRRWPAEAVDVHDVVVRKRSSVRRLLLACLFLTLVHAYYLFVAQDTTLGGAVWRLFYSAVFVKMMLRKVVVKESVVVIPAFGVQLETHHSSGQVIRRFVPVNKILKPVLTECVTPVTCYWSLSLILENEADLVLVFKELRPPLKMLVPIWKALCLASVDAECSDASVEVAHQRQMT